MNKRVLLLAIVLSVFLVGMLCAFAVEPVEAHKYKNKKSIKVKVKDGRKKVRVKCKYKRSLQQYVGHKYKNGKRYDVCICHEYKNGMQGGKKGWWTDASNGGMEDYAKTGYKHNKYHPVTKITLH